LLRERTLRSDIESALQAGGRRFEPVTAHYEKPLHTSGFSFEATRRDIDEGAEMSARCQRTAPYRADMSDLDDDELIRRRRGRRVRYVQPAAWAVDAVEERAVVVDLHDGGGLLAAVATDEHVVTVLRLGCTGAGGHRTTLR